LMLKRGDRLLPVTVTLRDLIGPRADPGIGGKRGAIVAYLPRAVVFDRTDEEFFLVDGLAKASRGDDEGAVDDYAQAIAVDPAFAPAYCARAECREAEGDFTDAVADLNQAIALDPVYADAYADRGLSKEIQGDAAGAVADYDQATAFNPRNARAFALRGEAKSAVGDFPGAIADFSRVLALDPEDPSAYRARGIAREASGDLTGALVDYGSASPTPARADLFLRFRVSLVLRRLDMDEADRDLVEAVNTAEPGWGKTVGSYLIGDLSEPDLLAQADAGGAAGRSDRECEANYYVAMTHLLRHEIAPARDFLIACVATKASATEEYMLARGELARLPDSSS
jgi:lipoprotein NlpI